MNLTRDVQATLDAILQSLTNGRYAIRPPRNLLKSVERVRTRFGDGQAALATIDRVEQAVTRLKQHPEPSRRQLFVLAHALAQPLKMLRDRSVLEVPLGGALLMHWEHAASEGKFKSLHWRGLFHSYMQAKTGDACERLRRLLSSTLPRLRRASATQPEWLKAILRHQDLLGEKPCAQYVSEMLRGETALLDDIRAQVKLPPASWFWVSLKDALLQQIELLSEANFKSQINHLLSLPQRIPNARDGVLAAVLTRYAGFNDHPRHSGLLEFGLEAWGSPQARSQGILEPDQQISPPNGVQLARQGGPRGLLSPLQGREGS